MSETHDAAGNEWAKLSETKAGDILQCDEGFTCLRPDSLHEVQVTSHGLFVKCDDGQHYLQGQADDGDHLVGFYVAR